MGTLPIVKMTLYKHGVGFYQRRGTVAGDAVELVFPKVAMNDVLKSLTAFTVGAGQVTGMDFDTPEDKAALLGRSSFHLGEDTSLRDLARDLRGRRAVVVTAAGELDGQVIGVDLPGEREAMADSILSLWVAPQGAAAAVEAPAVVTAVPALGAVRPVRLGDITEIRLVDERAAADLQYVLETSVAAEDKRAVTVRLSEGGADLVVSYIAPSPTWRLSYRLVMENEAGTLRALLQGWGLFDNTFDEDLEDVRLTLIAGMPVSFVYDLYTPFTPQRPTLGEEARTLPSEILFHKLASDADEGERPAFLRRSGRMSADMVMAAPSGPAQLRESTAVSATGQRQGEFFSYTVSAPVSVRRGRSAMAPILSADLLPRKLRIYSRDKLPRNPFITLEVKNDTGLTLERGPLTVIEDGEYAGDAVLPFTAEGNTIYLAYAVDLSVKVSEETTTERTVESVYLKDGFLVVEENETQKTVYRVENEHKTPVEVMIEHARMPGYAPYDTPEPAETTAEHYRYRLEVAGGRTQRFVAKLRRRVARREEVYDQQLERLRKWLSARTLDAATYAVLEQVVALRGQITEQEARIKANGARREESRAAQKAARENLSALQQTGAEGELRARYVRKLAEEEDAQTALAAADVEARRAIEDTRGSRGW